MLTGHCHALASRRAKVKKEEEGEGEGGERRRRRAPLSFRPPSSTFFPPHLLGLTLLALILAFPEGIGGIAARLRREASQ